MSLEAQEIVRSRTASNRLSGERAGVPRAVRRDHDVRSDLETCVIEFRRRSNAKAPAFTREAGDRTGLQHIDAGANRGIQQQGIELLAAEGLAPTWAVRAGQPGVQRRSTSEKPY